MPEPRTPVPDDPTVAQIAELLGETYKSEGVVVWLTGENALLGGDRPIDQMRTAAGRRHVYGMALAMAEGVFT